MLSAHRFLLLVLSPQAPTLAKNGTATCAAVGAVCSINQSSTANKGGEIFGPSGGAGNATASCCSGTNAQPLTVQSLMFSMQTDYYLLGYQSKASCRSLHQ